MSMELIRALHEEARRVMIAGSELAAGDIRLRKMIPALQALGEKAPVFGRIAASVEQLTEPGPGSEAKLIELVTLLHSILYTQGGIAPAAETVRDFAPAAAQPETRVSYRKLKPLLAALTETGGGRLEAIRSAYEEGLFGDFRLLEPSIGALDDPYPDIADYATEKLVPRLGAAALPLLVRSFDPNGGKGHARRLRLIRQLGGEAERGRVFEAAEDGSPDVRIAAIELLADEPAAEEALLRYAGDKKKEIRRAALQALSLIGTDAAAERLLTALRGKDADIAVEPIRACGHARLTEWVLEEAEASLATAQREESAAKEAARQALDAAVRCLQGKTGDRLFRWIRSALADAPSVDAMAESTRSGMAAILLDSGDADQLAFLVSLRDAHRSRFIACGFRAAYRTLPAERLYELFAPYLTERGTFAAKEIVQTIRESLDESDNFRLDIRWIHRFVELDEEELVCRFEVGQDRRVCDYLAAKLAKERSIDKDGAQRLLAALFRERDDRAPDQCMKLLEAMPPNQWYYVDPDIVGLLSQLPAAYADRLETYASSVKAAYARERLLEVVQNVRANTASGQGKGWLSWLRK